MDLTLNNAVMGVELSGIRQFTYLVRDTPGACALTIGEPDLNTPDVIKEAAKAALDANDTHYPPGNGYPYALEAISKFEAEAHGLHYAPSEVILTVGATEALFASFSTILNPGDEVIIPTPAFGLYEALVQLQGGVPVSLPTEHNHFQIVPEELKAAITDRTKAIILTSPNNPTGCVYTKETLDAVHAILRDKPIFVLCDDVYRTLTYCEDYHSFAEYQDMRDRIIVVQSFSKPYAIYLEPANGVRWQKKVVVLTNRRSFSATNDFVNHMRCLPNVTTIGDKTGGGSGMPFTSELPNGWSVRFSASPHFDAEMNHIEFGIEPDIKADMLQEDELRGKDTLIEMARKLLSE